MTTDTPTPDRLPPSRDALADQLLDMLLDEPSLFGVIGEVLRKAAPLLYARHQLADMPEVPEP